MAQSIPKRDMILKQAWNVFLSHVKTDLNQKYLEQRQMTNDIKKLERIVKILEHNEEDIDFFIMHKESMLNLDPNLNTKLAILEAFKKRNNLNNPVALRTCKEIRESKKLCSSSLNLNVLKEKYYAISQIIDKLEMLIDGRFYDMTLIERLIVDYNLNANEGSAIRLYPIIQTLKKPVLTNDKTSKLPLSKENPNIKVDQNPKNSIAMISEFKEDYEKIKTKYETIKTRCIHDMNKYQSILNNMQPREMQIYKAYSMYTKDELDTLNLSSNAFDEALVKVLAIRLFDNKKEIEKLMQSIMSSNYVDKDNIDLLEAYVSEFEGLVDKLNELDKKLVTTIEEKNLINSKVFFLLGKEKKPLIPSVIKDRGYMGSLINVIDKVKDGYIPKKQGNNITTLKIRDKEFLKACGKTVFALRNYKVIVSYIKLNVDSRVNNEGGIMVLTASLLNPNTIEEDTNKVIREYRNDIMHQLSLIERKDPAQLAVQDVILKEIQNDSKEGELNGRKVK